MARRPGRAAAKHAAAALKNTPQLFEEVEDETMQDAPASDAGTPQEQEEDVNDDEAGTPAQDSDNQSGPGTPRTENLSRKRRGARSVRSKPPDWDGDDGDRDGSDRGTPRRGRRGLAKGAGRWARRGGPSHVTQQPIDKEGNMLDVVDDEVELPEDAEGEKKVNKMGLLQDGREYRCRTFKVKGRGDRLYMLSTEPARCVGFRDSYLFFAKHKRLFKIIIDEEEKKDLIERELIPHSYKGRAIGIVTARSVFREFGAQIIVAGRRVTDDYEVTKAREEGAVEGQLADPADAIKSGENYNKNQYVAWHGASSVYHTGQPTVPLQGGKLVDGRRRRTAVNDINWMLEHAREASQFNSALAAARRRNLNGVYDAHTNLMQYPATMQPTHARWESMIKISGASQVADINQLSRTEPEPHVSIFTKVKPEHARHFLIVDSIYENPRSSQLGIPGPDGDVADMGFNGLARVPSEIRNELPESCRKAFEEALTEEMEWKDKWSAESVDAKRRAPIIDKGLIM